MCDFKLKDKLSYSQEAYVYSLVGNNYDCVPLVNGTNCAYVLTIYTELTARDLTLLYLKLADTIVD